MLTLSSVQFIILVQTIPGERFFQPLLGSDVHRSLFDFVDFATAGVIENQIITTIQNFEERVGNVKGQVEPESDVNTFSVTVYFDIVGQDLPVQDFTFILEATR